MRIIQAIKTLAAAAGLLVLTAGGVTAQSRGQTARELPAELRGSWGVEAEDCNDADSEGRINVSANSIDSPGIKFNLNNIRQLPNGAWRANAIRSEAGKKRKTRTEIEIGSLAPDRLSFRVGKMPPEEFSFCRPSRLIG
ncbi:MAG: hypothetical protein FJX29_10670 [Alphaproteobacteria bacterium]|nr:hypothetical protein [Alphaproteobacteria bacterium]